MGPTRSPLAAMTERPLILVTAAYNEADRIAGLADSLAQVAPQPIALWVVVDDGGSDDLPGAVAALGSLAFPVAIHRRDNSGGLANASELAAFREGAAIGLCEVPTADWVMKLDADLRLEPDYFAHLLDTGHDVGMVGGVIVDRGETAQAHHVRGGLRAYRREAWDLHLTLPCALGWDVLDQVLVRSAGLVVQVVPDARAVTSRVTGSSVGLLAGRRRLGVVCRLTGYSLPYLLLKLSRVFVQRPLLVGGIAFLRGYFSAGASPFEPQLRATHRAEQRARLRSLLRNRAASRRLYPSP